MPTNPPWERMMSGGEQIYNFGDVLPINWQLRPNDSEKAECPEAWRVLATFAISSLVVTVLSVALSHRGVVRFMTAGLLGKIYDRRPSTFAKIKFALQFLLPVGLQLAGNAVVVHMIFSTPGYGPAGAGWSTFFFLFAARPRHSWIVLAFLARVRRTRWFDDEYPWRVAAASNAFSEFLLQFLALFTMGGIAHFGDTHRFGLVWSSEHERLPQAAKLFYAGAFLYVVMGVFGMIPLALTWAGIFRDFFSNDALIADTVKGLGQRESLTDRPYVSLISLACLFSTWLASWLFWIGYVQLADPVDKYVTAILGPLRSPFGHRPWNYSSWRADKVSTGSAPQSWPSKESSGRYPGCLPASSERGPD